MLRLYQAARVAPVWVGLGIAAVYLLLFEVLSALTGMVSTPYGPADQLASQSGLWETVNAVIVAYLLTANAYAVRVARRDLAQLRPHLEASDAAFEALVEGATNLPRWALVAASAIAVGMGAMLATLDPGVWAGGPVPPVASPLFVWVLFRNTLICWSGVRVGVTEVALTRGFLRAAGLVGLDLLDTRPLAAFARKSQRSLALWVGFSVLFSLFFLGHPARANSFFLCLILAVLVTVFLLPLLGVHRRIGAAKAEELLRVNEQIRRARDGETPASASGPRLADWVAYRGLVEGVREWPIATSALLRSLLFAALGLGSWLGGALVDRLLGALLD